MKILVVDKEADLGMRFVCELALPDSEVVFVSQALQAIKNIKKNDYDVILIGDRIDGGDIMDIGLALNGSIKNRKTPTVCIGYHKGRAAQVVKLLKPYALRAHPADFSVALAKVRDNLQLKDERSSCQNFPK